MTIVRKLCRFVALIGAVWVAIMLVVAISLLAVVTATAGTLGTGAGLLLVWFS